MQNKHLTAGFGNIFYFHLIITLLFITLLIIIINYYFLLIESYTTICEVGRSNSIHTSLPIFSFKDPITRENETGY